MKFIIDAQPRGGPLPQLLAAWLKEHGFDAIHTLELPAANRSDDKEIIVVADQDDRIVVSKDSDFFDDHILTGKPKRLLVIKTGNIKNRDLIRLFEGNIERIESLFKRYVLIEMNRDDNIMQPPLTRMAALTVMLHIEIAKSCLLGLLFVLLPYE